MPKNSVLCPACPCSSGTAWQPQHAQPASSSACPHSAICRRRGCSTRVPPGCSSGHCIDHCWSQTCQVHGNSNNNNTNLELDANSNQHSPEAVRSRPGFSTRSSRDCSSLGLSACYSGRGNDHCSQDEVHGAHENSNRSYTNCRRSGCSHPVAASCVSGHCDNHCWSQTCQAHGSRNSNSFLGPGARCD